MNIHLQAILMFPRGTRFWHTAMFIHDFLIVQWIGLRENLQETIDFPIKYGAFL